MTLGSVAFLAAAAVQRMIDTSPEGSVSMTWQVPQYLIMTCGEVLFSITGTSFHFHFHFHFLALMTVGVTSGLTLALSLPA